MHETTWESSRLGGTPPPCDVTPGRWPWGAGGRPANEMLAGIRQSLADGGQSQGPRRASAQTCAGKAEILEPEAALPAAQDDAQGCRNVRILHGPLDPVARRQAHRPHLRGSVPPRLRLEGAAWGRLELSETRAASPGARRGGHREVANGTLAPYKKTPAEPAERSYFSMKVASCSNRWSDAPGHREARRRFCDSGTVATDSRPSVQSRLLRTAGAMACTGLSTLTISGAEKSSNSFRDCGDICRRDSRSFGTADNRTEQSWSRTGSHVAGASLSSGCHPTRQISTRWRRSGATPSTGTWRTMLPTAFKISNNPSSLPWSGRKVRVACFRRSSEPQG